MGYLINENIKIIEQSNISEKFTSPQEIVSNQNLTSSYVSFGGEISMINYNMIGIGISADCNDSGNVWLKIVGLTESGGNEYLIMEEKLWSSTTETDFNEYVYHNIGTAKIIKILCYAETVGVTPGDLTITINKKYC